MKIDDLRNVHFDEADQFDQEWKEKAQKVKLDELKRMHRISGPTYGKYIQILNCY